ncbi:MAG: zinc ribbon domain-containing protein [Clostridiales bacterium]|nr:zinc ribbon domain-containing protein [Clostridiales bacterium]
MKSIKPGRGPSGIKLMGAMGAVAFGILWTFMAVFITSGAPSPIKYIFPLFGVIFVFIGIFQVIYHLKNLKGKERFSLYDIVDSKEEDDTTNRWITNDAVMGDNEPNINSNKHDYSFCPYCKHELDNDDKYCPNCGRELD